MSINPRARFAVIGAGISGLTTAYYLRRLLPLSQVDLFEREATIGGTTSTISSHEATVELGPNAVLANQHEIARLLGDLGLREQLIAASPAASRRFLFVDGQLRQVGPGPMDLLREGVLSEAGLLRALAEPFCVERGAQDESVFDFFVRHFGGELAQRLAHPLTTGVCAGEARDVEMASVFPDIKRLEGEHRSVVLGMVASRLGGKAAPSRQLYTLPGGLQQISDAIAATPGLNVHNATGVRRVARADIAKERARFVLRTEAGDRHFYDAVVSAAPAYAAQHYLQELSPELSALLRRITYAPMAVVTLALPAECREQLPDAFGFLVRRGEGLRMLGCQFTSSLFPQQVPSGEVMVRALYGGSFDPDVMRLDDRTLVQTALAELQRILGLHALPEFSHVQRWARAIPQLKPGHQARVERIDAELRRIPGLYIGGNAVRGLSWRECAGAGYALASRIARQAYGG